MIRRALLLSLAGFAACANPDRPAPTGPTVPVRLTPSAAISDGSSSGDAHFFWLPPIAPARTYPGTFDPGANPELRICPFSAATNACTSAAVIYTRSSSPSIVVSTSAQSYTFDWSTKPASITTGDYRAEVRLGGRVLGYADARVVTSAKDLKAVPAGFVGVQDGKTLTFAFRIETGIVASISIAPRGDSVTVGETRQFTATVLDANGAVLSGAAVTWSSAQPNRATISATGLATGVSAGFTRIVASSGGVIDSTILYVRQVPVARVVISPAGTTALTVGGQATFTATMYDASNNVLTGRALLWQVFDTAVVMVSSAGVATARGPGLAYLYALSESKRDSVLIDVTGASVTCLRPWAVPDIWFAPNVVGRAVTGRYGTPNQFTTVIPTSTSGNYYPIAVGDQSSSTYSTNILSCTSTPITLGAGVPLSLGNLVSPTVAGLDSLFARDPNAAWDPTANGGLGGIVGSNAPHGSESARVVQVPLYVQRDQSAGSATVRFRRTATVFLDSYASVDDATTGARRGDITFRFLRFGP